MKRFDTIIKFILEMIAAYLTAIMLLIPVFNVFFYRNISTGIIYKDKVYLKEDIKYLVPKKNKRDEQ